MSRRIVSHSFCGCYYVVPKLTPNSDETSQQYLPLVRSEAHTTILSTNSRTNLKQIFTNNTQNKIEECIYTFPLYDGVSVAKFSCRIGSRTLHGVVKEKTKARAVYDNAVAKGESAGLLEQSAEASDIFSTKLGNIPIGETVDVNIEYIGELKQDAETNGIRFTIPTKIAPRYGSVSNTPATSQDGVIKIIVDVQMPSGSFIQGIQSPSHPIAVAMGTLSTQSGAEPSMTKASASLSLGESALDHDFVLIVLAKDTGTPQAFLETHPTIPNQRALMATLVPKFSLPPSRPEIVFVADRSGSMTDNILILISAMKVFLKSLPVGVKFNICSFGSGTSFLWPKSKSYTQDTLAEAIGHVELFAADMGGTETFAAVKATIEQRFKDIPLEVMLLTDGDIRQQEELFSYINEEIQKSKGAIRVFPLGIGNGVSHSLIEGVARAGNGFAQSVQDGEKLDNRLVRMLKGALSPHITDYTLEVKYEVENETHDFEIIEVFDKVTETLKASIAEVEKEEQKEQAPISLFDSKMDVDTEEKPVILKDRYAGLPKLVTPKLIQAPHRIPPLFAFNRTTVYLLMSPDTVQKTPKSVVLRGTSAQGPLELEIPVEVLAEPGETVHQLAAKKVVQDLEEGRGWLFDAKDGEGKLLKMRFESKFDDMVEREAVRLGVQFQIAGKWCSFVAVAATDKKVAGSEEGEWEMVHWGKSNTESRLPDFRHRIASPSLSSLSGSSQYRYSAMPSMVLQPDCRFVTRHPITNSSTPEMSELKRSNLRELAAVNRDLYREHEADSSASIGNKSAAPSGVRQATSLPPAGINATRGGGAIRHRKILPPIDTSGEDDLIDNSDEDMGFGAFDVDPPAAQQQSAQPQLNQLHSHHLPAARPADVDWNKASDADKVLHVIALQAFDGWWEFSPQLMPVIGVTHGDVTQEPVIRSEQLRRVLATMCVVVWLEEKMRSEEEVWELVVEKARAWVVETVGVEGVRKQEVEARSVLGIRA